MEPHWIRYVCEDIYQRRPYDNDVQEWTTNDGCPSEDHKKHDDRKSAGRLHHRRGQ